MTKPNVLIFSGYGLNSEHETAYGFELAGAKADIVHINDVIDGTYKLKNYQILSFPGGFSYGDDTGSGNAYAHKIKNHLWEEVQKFISHDKLVIGICNGCQIVVNLGLIPDVALLHNQSARLVCRWTDMQVTSNSPWLSGIKNLSLPIAHGEGKFFATEKTLQKLRKRKQVALRYVLGPISTYLDLPANPNGSVEDIAGLTDTTGKILALMPHPERGMFFLQRPDWPLQKEQYKREGKPLPEFADGITIFQNAVKYFK